MPIELPTITLTLAYKNICLLERMPTSQSNLDYIRTRHNPYTQALAFNSYTGHQTVLPQKRLEAHLTSKLDIHLSFHETL